MSVSQSVQTRRRHELRARRANARPEPAKTWPRQLPKALVLAFALTFASQPIADAHSVYQRPTVYNANNGDQCVHLEAELTHGDYENGEANATTYSKAKAFGFWDCGVSKTKNPGEMFSRWEYWYNPYPYNDNTYYLCQETEYWWSNGNAASSIRTGANWVYFPCGSAYYGTFAGGDVSYQGSFRGPWLVWSGSHLFEGEGGSK